MGFLTEVAYSLVLAFISIYKFVESNIYTLFDGIVTKIVTKKFLERDIKLNGNRPWDIKVHNQKFYNVVATHGGMGMGKAYVEGWWDCEKFDHMITKMWKGEMYRVFLNPINRFILYLELELFNLQTKEKAFEVGEQHYDLGNDLYEAMLGPTMQYTCAYWPRARNLEEAQTAKMELIAQKMKLKPGMRVLDLGCGWGFLAKYLAEHHGVEVVGITVGKEGAKYAREKCRGLKVDIRVMDYRDMHEKFDRVCAVGIMEHIGRKNYRTFFEVVNRCLVDDGIFVCHHIGINDKYVPRMEQFTCKFIFVNGRVPYHKEIIDACEDLFIIEDWHNIGCDYDKTLQCWWDNFTNAWPRLESKYGEKFFRLWRLYILGAQGLFRSRKWQLWQMVYTKKGLEGGYVCPR